MPSKSLTPKLLVSANPLCGKKDHFEKPVFQYFILINFIEATGAYVSDFNADKNSFVKDSINVLI